MNSYLILIAVSSVVIASYLLGLFSRWARVPSVLLLLLLGAVLSTLSRSRGIVLPDLSGYVQVFGTLGLILIVLEASIDLELSREKRSMILRAAFSAFAIILLSAAGIASVFRLFFGLPWRACVVNAIPLSIISSAITIPSIRKIDPLRREFLTYESTFSDILGVLLFNFAAREGPLSLGASAVFAVETTGLVLGSVVVVFLLVLILKSRGEEAKFFLVIAVLTLVYSIAKLFHLSPLILVLAFGLTLGNLAVFLPARFRRLVDTSTLSSEIPAIHRFTKELAFFIRTFFFLIFGMSIQVETLLSLRVLVLGAAVVLIIFTIRFLFLKVLGIGAGATEILVSPRGLVTVLLVYGIPPGMRAGGVYDDMVYAVILISGILMSLGLALAKPGEKNLEILDS